jgi:carboxylate-amine ligase
MSDRFTLGIEEEFQLVRRQTGELCSCAQSVLEKSFSYFEEKIKPEILQSMVEFASAILPDITTARRELYTARAVLARIAAEEGLALISAGTHPSALWWSQERSNRQRYMELEEEYQDVARSILIFGLHIHVAIESKEMAIKVMNQARTWLPHLLAFSSNSPFWIGRMTGLKSYRSVVWRRFPRSGMPEIFRSWDHFDRYVQDLIDLQCIDNGKKIWWDVRPHPFFNTIEFRIFDMPATLEDTLALAAICQALVAKLVRLNERGAGPPSLPRDYIEENKWRAMRYGLDAEVLDFTSNRRLPMRDSLRELLGWLADVVDELGSKREIAYAHSLLNDPRGSGADRQIALYQETGDIEKVIQFRIEQTMQGVPVDIEDLSHRFLRFRMQTVV